MRGGTHVRTRKGILPALKKQLLHKWPFFIDGGTHCYNSSRTHNALSHTHTNCTWINNRITYDGTSIKKGVLIDEFHQTIIDEKWKKRKEKKRKTCCHFLWDDSCLRKQTQLIQFILGFTWSGRVCEGRNNRKMAASFSLSMSIFKCFVSMYTRRIL